MSRSTSAPPPMKPAKASGRRREEAALLNRANTGLTWSPSTASASSPAPGSWARASRPRRPPRRRRESAASSSLGSGGASSGTIDAAIRAGTTCGRVRTAVPAIGSGAAAANNARSISSSQFVNGRAARRALSSSTTPSSAPAGRVASATSDTSASSASCPRRTSAVRSAPLRPGRRSSEPSPMSRGRPASSMRMSAAESRVCTKPRRDNSATASTVGASSVTASPAVTFRSARMRDDRDAGDAFDGQAASPVVERGDVIERGQRARDIRRHRLDLDRDRLTPPRAVVDPERDERRPAVASIGRPAAIDGGEVDVGALARGDAPEQPVPRDSSVGGGPIAVDLSSDGFDGRSDASTTAAHASSVHDRWRDRASVEI